MLPLPSGPPSSRRGLLEFASGQDRVPRAGCRQSRGCARLGWEESKLELVSLSGSCRMAHVWIKSGCYWHAKGLDLKSHPWDEDNWQDTVRRLSQGQSCGHYPSVALEGAGAKRGRGGQEESQFPKAISPPGQRNLKSASWTSGSLEKVKWQI